MRVRQMTPSGDMTFGNGSANFLVDSPACVGQIVKTSLELWLGEWSFDTSLGMPYLEGVLGKHDQTTSDLAIQNYILNIQGVTDIITYESAQDRQGRTFVSQLTLQTQFSETPTDVVNQTDF